MYDKLRISEGNLKLKIFWRKLRYKDRHRNTFRIKLKNEVETLSDKTRFSSNIFLLKLRKCKKNIEIDLLGKFIKYNAMHMKTIRILIEKGSGGIF